MATRIIAFDVETPNHRNDRICSIGISIVDDGILVDTRTFLVNPECEFDRRNIDVHGIHPEDVANAPTFDLVWNEISSLFRSNLVAAHNAMFDLSVLKKTLAAYGISESLLYFVCTMKIAQKVLDNVENYKLPTLCNYYNIALTHHNAGSDSCACAEILCKLHAEGIDLDSFIQSYSLVDSDNTLRQPRSRESAQTHALHNLNEILSSSSVDGVLSLSEIEYLQKWLDENSSLSGNYPYDKIYHTLTDVLADGVIEISEMDAMLSLFQRVSDPISSIGCGCEKIAIEGRTFCLSGDFVNGGKTAISNILTSRGGIVLNSVSKKIDVLIVGGMGSSEWSAGTYGTKIKKALELQEKGIDIKIIKEVDFFAMLEC